MNVCSKKTDMNYVSLRKRIFRENLTVSFQLCRKASLFLHRVGNNQCYRELHVPFHQETADLLIMPIGHHQKAQGTDRSTSFHLRCHSSRKVSLIELHLIIIIALIKIITIYRHTCSSINVFFPAFFSHIQTRAYIVFHSLFAPQSSQSFSLDTT